MAILAPTAEPASASPEAPRCQPWRGASDDAITDRAELCRLVGLPLGTSSPDGEDHGFPLLVPRTLLGRIRPGDPKDPVLLQVLPQTVEAIDHPGFTTDPLAEAGAAQSPGLVRKYQDRLLIVASGACAVHCRFCFRRHFPYGGSPRTLEEWEAIVGEIAGAESIREVILSGGDPLTLDDEFLAWLATRLAKIPQLTRLRVHTRLPIMVPQRVTDGLLAWLRGTRLATFVVVHVNHPAEIDQSVGEALTRLVEAGIPVLSQSVLLRGVNDRVDVLAALFERLADLRVMPYYLHQLDRVAGAAHFEVPEHEGIELVRQLRARLPGYAVPRYVRQPPCGPSKLVLA